MADDDSARRTSAKGDGIKGRRRGTGSGAHRGPPDRLGVDEEAPTTTSGPTMSMGGKRWTLVTKPKAFPCEGAVVTRLATRDEACNKECWNTSCRGQRLTDDELSGGRKLQSTSSSSSWHESRHGHRHHLRGEEENIEVGSELDGAKLRNGGHGG